MEDGILGTALAVVIIVATIVAVLSLG